MTSQLDDQVQVLVMAVTGSPLPGVRVAAFDRDPLLLDDPLGSAITDERGLATIRFLPSDYSEHPCERGPDIYFRLSFAGMPLPHQVEDPAADDGVLRNFQQRPQAVLPRSCRPPGSPRPG